MPPAAVRSQEAQGLAIGMLQGKRAWKPALPKIATVNGQPPSPLAFISQNWTMQSPHLPPPRCVNVVLRSGRAGICSEFRLQAVFRRAPRRMNAGLRLARAGICSEFRLQAVFHRAPCCVNAGLQMPRVLHSYSSAGTVDPSPSAAALGLARIRNGTREGTRTLDQLVKSQLLYRLSYPRTGESNITVGRR